MSYVGVSNTYVGVSNSYVGDNKSYVGVSNLLSPTKVLVTALQCEEQPYVGHTSLHKIYLFNWLLFIYLFIYLYLFIQIISNCNSDLTVHLNSKE